MEDGLISQTSNAWGHPIGLAEPKNIRNSYLTDIH
jgi:hypothetical protein